MPDKNGKKQRVYEVTEVNAHLEGNVIIVNSKGTTRTGGWKNGELRPANGGAGTGLRLEFVATPPNGPSTDAITPIEAKEYRTGPLLPPFPTEVTVIAETNEKTVFVGRPK
jgi:hypothetical protein